MPDAAVPARVAVQVGAATVRVAVAAVDGAPRLVAAVPRARFRSLHDLLADVVGGRPAELVLVQQAAAPPAAVEAEVVAATGLAATVRAVAAPVAAATGTDAVAVLDVGWSGAEATVLGSLGGRATAPAGGAALDSAFAGPVAVRETLSLLPEVGEVTAAAAAVALEPVLRQAVAALERAMAGATGPVLLIGGVARTPLLAELVDAAGIAGVVAERPESAAVLGALRQEPVPAVPMSGPGPQPWLPALPQRRPQAERRSVGVFVAAVGAAGLLWGGQLMAPAAAAPAGELAQYGYAVALPEGWEHTGGLPERRRSLLTPAAARAGSDLIAVEASPLGYDTAAEPDRAAAELRSVYDGGVAAGAALSGYEPAVSYAGRAVTSYRQQDTDGVVVDWYVMLDGDAQLSVGCRHTPAGSAAVASACALVVGTLHRT